MLRKEIKHPNYNFINVQTSKFKDCIIEINFQKEIKEHDLIERLILTDVMTYTTKDYPTKSKLAIKRQELYDLYIGSSCTRLGNVLNTSFFCRFVAPKYIKEDDYLENVIKLLMEIIFKPNVLNNAFDLNTFNTIKNNTLSDIECNLEDPGRVAISNALNSAFPNSVTHYNILSERDYLKDLTADDLWNIYDNMLKNDTATIFAVGDLDADNIDAYIHKYFSCNVIKSDEFKMSINNDSRRGVLKKEDKSTFVQSQLIMIYNMNKLTKSQKEVIPYIFNNVFGNGSLNSKLFRYLREDNSLCYGVGCLFLKYDNLLLVKVSLAKENIDKAIRLTKKAVKEMQRGEFSLNDLTDAKKSATFSLKVAQDSINNVLTNYIFNYYDDFALPEARLKKIKTITKDDITSFAKTLKLNTIYILNEGGSNEGNSN